MENRLIYRIKEKFWSIGDDFVISDQNGNPQYLVEGEAFSWGDNLSFQDSRGHELAVIKQEILSFRPSYQILIDGKIFAKVEKKFNWFKKEFELDVPGPNDYEIHGRFWKHEYVFRRANAPVATISKDFWGWSDSYGVEIKQGEDSVSILCACIVIDQVLEDEKNKS